MLERLAGQVEMIATNFPNSPVTSEFISRSKEGLLTRDENPYSHFCVYFAAHDRGSKEVFIGHHKKSELWIFNGGHIDKDETPEEALVREIGEEWGIKMDLESIGEPKLITITTINNQIKHKCKKHYDIWYFVPVLKNTFTPDKEKLNTEFYTTGWRSISEARSVITDPNTLKAVSEFEKLFV